MTGDSLWLRCLFTYFLTRIGLQSCFSPFFPSLRRPLEMDTVSLFFPFDLTFHCLLCLHLSHCQFAPPLLLQQPLGSFGRAHSQFGFQHTLSFGTPYPEN